MDETQHIFIRLKHIQQKLERRGCEFLKEDNLTLVQGQVLEFLCAQENHCSTMKKLEKELGVAQSTCASLLYRLEKKGHITLEQDSKDKRIKWVYLTKMAEERAEYLGSLLNNLENEIFSNFTPVEQTAFVHLLDKLDMAL